MTEHSMKLYEGEALKCSTCKKIVVAGRVVQLVAALKDDEWIAEVLCQDCSGKRGK
jgi:DNA-directed RNA polymerase subunit RPC12/RpoP